MKKYFTLAQKIPFAYCLVSVFFMAIFMGIVLPYEASLLNEYLNGLSAPDTRFFYTSDTLYHIAAALNETGRNAYIISRLRFDIAWPLVYSFFFYTSISVLFKHSMYLNKVLLIVFFAFLFDLLENTIVSLVFYYYPKEILFLPHIAGFMTLFKWLAISVLFIVMVFGLYKKLFQSIHRS